MSAPLSENDDHLHALCERFALGSVRGDVVSVAGGFHHRMWRVDTDQDRIAIKQLGNDVPLSEPQAIARYNASERVAARFAERGIPALAALDRDNEYLQLLDDSAYLVYPWVEGAASGRNAITADQRDTVAGILARMHGADIEVPELGRELPDLATRERIVELVTLARQRNVHGSALLEARIDDVLAVVDRLEAALPVLQERSVISHGDLDHKNVLWNDRGEPVLIDWESAMYINPTYETLLEALDWSGITAHFEIQPFEQFLRCYGRAGGQLQQEVIDAAFTTILGAWINWLMYNVGRALGLEGRRLRAIGSEQVDLALDTLLRLERQIPRLRDIAARHAS